MEDVVFASGPLVLQMLETIPPGDSSVLVQSLLALAAFVLIGAALAYDASARGMPHPAAWGGAVFVSLFLGVLFTGRLLPGVVQGGVVVGLYLIVRE